MFDKKLIINFSKTKDFECIDYYFKYTVRKAIKAALLHEEFPHDVNVEITFCDNAYIKSLNKEFRGKNSATDVLSFPLYDFTAGDEAFIIPGEIVSLGNIVISLERAKKQAEEIGNTFLTEVAFLAVHSVLHLLGYDHEKGKAEEEAQCAAQKEIMTSLEI